MRSVTEKKEQALAYDELHKKSDLRFPLEDYPRFLEVLGVEEGRKLSDIACGKGFLLAEAEKKGIEAFGLDFSNVGLEFAAKRYSRGRLVACDAEQLPIKDNSQDYLTNLGSLEHFANPGLAVKEMSRVLRDDGRAMIIVPNLYSLATIWKVYRYGVGEKQEEQELRNFTTIADWTELIESNGLRILKTIKYNGFDHIDWYFRRKDPKVVPMWERVCRLVMNYAFKPVIPLNLSGYFIFICSKGILQR